MKYLGSFLLFIVILSCSSSKAPVKTNYGPQIPIKKLLSQGIVPYHSEYKSRYYELLPYLYYNGGGDFIEVKGDFYSLRHPIHKEVNIMVGFWADYVKLKDVLLAFVWVQGYNKAAVDTSLVQVFSSKHGQLLNTPFRKSPYRTGFYKEAMLTKKIPLEKSSDIIKKLYDDVITIIVDGYKYELLNPELELD